MMPQTRNGDAEGEARRDLGASEEPDERCEEIEPRRADALRRVERPLVDAYSASSN
jgi:hypothetical protein